MGDIKGAIATEERGYWSIFYPDNVGLILAGPAVALFGSEEHKRKYLPTITSGEAVWFQAFTEPEAGTDEANVQLRAKDVGDAFILNGQKRFVTQAHPPTYLYTLTRTADTVPKHRGISLFLIPGDTPGITYRAMPDMSGTVTNEVFFDDVQVPKSWMLGQLNRGFYHAMATFEFERTGTHAASSAKRNLEEFVQYCKETERNGKPLWDDPQVRDTVARIAADVEAFRLISWHTVWWFSQRDKLGPQPYDLTGFFTKVLGPLHAEAMMSIMGLEGQLRAGSKWVKLNGSVQHAWQGTRSMHGGGTIEAYKIAIARRGLSLPRHERPAAPVAAKAEKKK